MLRLGYTDGRDLCGPEEEGKDVVFGETDRLGTENLVVVQTKRGNVTLAGNAAANLENAVVQLRTAAVTTIALPKKKIKMLPSTIILCASGTINAAARKHIVDQLQNPALKFLDADDLVPLLDSHFPELWLDIQPELMPYMRGVRTAIEDSTDAVVAEVLPGAAAAASDDIFVDVSLWRTVTKLKKRSGKTERVPAIVDVPITSLLTSKERLVLLLGEAGSGKSTAVRRLAYLLAGDAVSGVGKRTLIPVMLRAVDVARFGGTLTEMMAEHTRSISHQARAAFTNEELTRGDVVVGIDGLDEVANHEARSLALSRVSQFYQLYPKCLVIATSREYAFLTEHQELAAFEQYRMARFNMKQAERLVKKLERKVSLPAESASEFLRRLEDIHGMDLNPLLVTVFAATSDAGRRDIPANITELFAKFTEVMLGRWDASKGFAQQYQSPLKRFVLSKIAFEMHLARTTQISLEEFRSRVTAELAQRNHKADIDLLLDEILERSALLRVVGDRVEFRHLLLQEYFAGIEMPEELVETLAFDEWWRRAIVFFFGTKPGTASGISRIRSVLGTRAAMDRFVAATTLGLALQACYLLPVNEKMSAAHDVIDTLADVKDEVIAAFPGSDTFPLSRFVAYYLSGRDSVAISALAGDDSGWPSPRDEEHEAITFWRIVGLLEGGQMEAAETLIDDFRPTDARFGLALHLGCFLIERIRVTSPSCRKIARRLQEKLAPAVVHLRKQILSEFQSELLEIRRGKLVPLLSDGTPNGSDEEEAD